MWFPGGKTELPFECLIWIRNQYCPQEINQEYQ